MTEVAMPVKPAEAAVAPGPAQAVESTPERLFLSLFWELADHHCDTRLAAANAIVTAAMHNPSVMDYTLRRLVKGLISSSKCARQGFATALTMILKQSQTPIDLETYFKVCDEVLNGRKREKHSSEPVGKQQIKDEWIGKVFVALVLCQSGRFGECSFEQVKMMIEEIDAVGQKKSWLEQIAFEALGQIFNCIQDEEILQKVMKLPQFALEAMQIEGVTLHELSLIFSIYLKCSQFEGVELPQKVIDLFEDYEKYKDLAKILLKAPKDVFMHAIWDKLLNWFIVNVENDGNPEEKESSVPLKRFAEFWSQIVDWHLFNATSPQRKALGFNLLQDALEKTKDERVVEIAISDKSLDVIFASTLVSKSVLNQTAKLTLTFIVECIKKQRHLASMTLSRICLNSKDGGVSFDRKTKTKTVKSLLELIDAKGVEDFVEKHISTLHQDGEKSIKHASVEQLFAIFNNPIVLGSEDLIKRVLTAFIEVAVFKPDGEGVEKLAMQRLFTCITTLSKRQEGSSWIVLVNNCFDALQQKNAGVHLSKDQITLRKDAEKAMNKLEKVDAEKLPEAQKTAMISLLRFIELLQISEKDEASELLEELISRTKNVAKDCKKETLVDYTTGVVDILLSLLVKPSALFRDVAKSVFRSLVEYVSEDIVNDLCNVLTSKPAGTSEDDEDDILEVGEGSEDEGHDSSDSDDDSDDEDVEERAENVQEDAVKDEDEDEEEDDDDDMKIEIDEQLMGDLDDVKAYTARIENLFKLRFNAKRLKDGMFLTLLCQNSNFYFRNGQAVSQFQTQNFGSCGDFIEEARYRCHHPFSCHSFDQVAVYSL
jgi:DNA polymerase phi